MTDRPAVIVNGLADAVTVLRAASGAPVVLLSAQGAALFAGCLWWREVIGQAQAAIPDSDAADILDCADASGLAVSALRIGQRAIVLQAAAPSRAAVVAIAAGLGAEVLAAAPPALDLGVPGAARRLHAWLHGGGRDTGRGAG